MAEDEKSFGMNGFISSYKYVVNKDKSCDETR